MLLSLSLTRQFPRDSTLAELRLSPTPFRRSPLPCHTLGALRLARGGWFDALDHTLGALRLSPTPASAFSITLPTVGRLRPSPDRCLGVSHGDNNGRLQLNHKEEHHDDDQPGLMRLRVRGPGLPGRWSIPPRAGSNKRQRPREPPLPIESLQLSGVGSPSGGPAPLFVFRDL